MSDIEAQMDKFVEDTAEERPEPAAEPEYVPTYRMITNDKIPVSKKHGVVWKSRFKAGLARLRSNKDVERWDECIRYYRNDHSQKREGEDVRDQGGTTLATRGMETENIVFANATAIVPAIYAKNPSIAVSMDDPRLEQFGQTAQKLLNVLFRRKSAPGLNLKPIARRLVLMATLTNYGYIEVGYTKKGESSEQVLIDLKKIGEQLAKAKTPKEIQELEGQLQALEARIDVLEPSGPWAKFRRPHDVVRDPDASTLLDCNWIMIGDYVPTQMLEAIYGVKDDEEGHYKAVFDPTHVLKLDADDGDMADEDSNFSIFASDKGKNYTDYGFESKEAFEKAQRTRVWYVWDKTTRRVYLFNEKDWTWPLWVWDDPYEFPNFFPLAELSFYEDPQDAYARSETSMMLDQQDGINMINNEVAKNRNYISGKVMYNKSVIKDENIITEFLDGTNKRRALGVDLGPDQDMRQIIHPFVPQSAEFLNTVIFDKTRLLEAIDRVTSVTNVMRGVEFKTNTTNKAIESYTANTQTRLDEKIDAIEDCLGYVGELLLHLCIRNMERDIVEKLIGPQDADIWEQDRQMIIESGVYFSAQVVGGSTLKPTSSTKKEQALQLGQTLGQFANASPYVILVMLKVLQRAFDEVVITKDDWDMIINGIQEQLQRGNSEGGGEEAPAPEATPQG
jgi:hypothetical protein